MQLGITSLQALNDVNDEIKKLLNLFQHIFAVLETSHTWQKIYINSLQRVQNDCKTQEEAAEICGQISDRLSKIL